MEYFMSRLANFITGATMLLASGTARADQSTSVLQQAFGDLLDTKTCGFIDAIVHPQPEAPDLRSRSIQLSEKTGGMLATELVYAKAALNGIHLPELPANLFSENERRTARAVGANRICMVLGLGKSPTPNGPR